MITKQFLHAIAFLFVIMSALLSIPFLGQVLSLQPNDIFVFIADILVMVCSYWLCNRLEV